jgi:tetratricopeptide (TPR) repeat protein
MTEAYDYLTRLGVTPGADERAIRRAYARELKLIDQEVDPAGFQSLREAYETALYWQRHDQTLATETANGDAPALATAGLAATDEDEVQRSPGHRPPQSDAHEQRQQQPEDQQASAAEAFHEFQQHCAALATAGLSSSDAPWQQLLRASLDDARLVNIVAREHFERQVAELLAQGWRPGHEALLVAAVKVFGWDNDRHRVRSLGYAGAVLDTAIDERAMFDALEDREKQRQLIVRLRDPSEPTARELVANTVPMELLISRFPTWMALVTSTDSMDRWRELDRSLPGWKRMLNFAGRSKPESYGEGRHWGIKWKWLIFVAVLTLTRMACHEWGSNTSPAGGEAVSTASSQARVNTDNILAKGDSLLNADDFEGAIASYTRVIQLSPGESNAYSNRAMASIFTDADDDRIVADLDKAEELDKNNANVPRGRGLLAMRQERYDAAITEFTKTLRLSPDHTYTLDQRAKSYESAGQLDMALADIDRRLKIKPGGSVEAYRRRIVVYLKQGNQAEAFEQIETMLGANKDNAEAYAFAAHLHLAVGQTRQAMSIIERGISEVPTSELYLARARMRDQTDIAGRRSDIQRSYALLPGAGDQLGERVKVELDDGKPEAALRILSDEIKRGDTSYSYQPVLRAYRAIVYEKTGQKALADEEFAAARAAAGTRRALNNLAWFLATENAALTTALSAVNAALGKEATSAAYLDTKGLVLLHMGHYRESVAAYDAALKLRPGMAVSQFGRGVAKRRAGDKAGGDADLKAARINYLGVDLEFAGYGVVP